MPIPCGYLVDTQVVRGRLLDPVYDSIPAKTGADVLKPRRRCPDPHLVGDFLSKWPRISAAFLGWLASGQTTST